MPDADGTIADGSGDQSPASPGLTYANGEGDALPASPGLTRAAGDGDESPDSPGLTRAVGDGDESPDSPGLTRAVGDGDEAPDSPGLTSADGAGDGSPTAPGSSVAVDPVPAFILKGDGVTTNPSADPVEMDGVELFYVGEFSGSSLYTSFGGIAAESGQTRLSSIPAFGWAVERVSPDNTSNIGRWRKTTTGDLAWTEMQPDTDATGTLRLVPGVGARGTAAEGEGNTATGPGVVVSGTLSPDATGELSDVTASSGDAAAYQSEGLPRTMLIAAGSPGSYQWALLYYADQAALDAQVPSGYWVAGPVPTLAIDGIGDFTPLLGTGTATVTALSEDSKVIDSGSGDQSPTVPGGVIP